MNASWSGPSQACGCVWLDDNFVDMSACRVHPLTCEALHPRTGKGCHHMPGHDGDHGYVEVHQWTASGEVVS